MTSQPLHRWMAFAAIAWGMLPGIATAQVDTSRTALPDIAPREVEIRGRLEISLPSLQRQPLVGFNPPPRVPRPPDGRRPYIETYKQSSADLPASPLRRPQPPSALVHANPPATGQVESVVGRYFSRAANARIQAPVAEQTGLYLRADYTGSEGHEPFDALSGVNTPYDALEGALGVQTARTRWTAGAAVSGFYERYDLYGLLPSVVPPDPADLDALPRFDREGRGGAGAVNVATLSGTLVDARVDLRGGATRYETRATGAAIPDEVLLTTERRGGVDLDLSFPVPVGDVWIDGTADAGDLGELGSYAAVEGGGGVRLDAFSTITLDLGARFLGAFSDTDQPRVPTNETARVGYVSPDVRVEVLPGNGVRLYAQNRPGVTPHTVADVFRTNPYLVAQPALRPTLRSIDAEAGVNLFVGPVQLALQAGYQEMPQYLFFENIAGTAGLGSITLGYDDAEIIHAGGSISVVLPGGLHAMVGASYRDGRLPDDDVEIPYFAPVVGEATLSYSFAQSRGLVQVVGYYESPRYVDRAQSRKVGSYLDLDVEGLYRVTRSLGVVLRVDNISGSDNERWEAYPQSPLVVGAGIRVSW